MKKIAVFTEGQTEQILLQHLLPQLKGWNDIRFECKKLYAERLVDVPYEYNSPDPEYHFLIIDTCGDEKVLSAILERIDNLLNAGYELFIGIRDMYGDFYKKRSPGRIDEALNKTIIERVNQHIQSTNYAGQIFFYFSIMEIEAWFLSMYNLFSRLHNSLTVEFIEERLGYNLRDDDPQCEFYHPAQALNEVFRLAGSRYDKSKDDVERICSALGASDFTNAVENGRVACFHSLYTDLSNL